MLNPTSWHIEPTSRCTLECPGCDRTWYKNTFGKQIIQDIDVDELTNFFSVNNFYGSQIRLCGNNGDPIYHPRFVSLLESLKSQNHNFQNLIRTIIVLSDLLRNTDEGVRTVFQILSKKSLLSNTCQYDSSKF